MSTALENRSFKYQPLTDQDGFRLILLRPNSSPTALVQCSLIHSTLAICDREIIDHYTALSYVWGDAQQTKQILVDEYLMTITATLEAALRDLRDGSRELRVWADALCIDQSNIEERNQQVQQMGRIYSTAHHTVIYLGSLTPPVEKVLQATRSRSSGRWTDFSTEEILDIVQTAENNVLNRPWFSRVWIFQELVLSRDPWVQCGGLRARWNDLCGLLLSVNTNREGLKSLTDMHFARKGQIQTGLFNLLLSRRGLGATDARDMVFAHLGVASDSAVLQGWVDVDYKQSVERLYENVAHYLIDTVGPETLFFHLDDINHGAQRLDLASWAPDWTQFPSPATPMYKDNRMNVVQLKPTAHYRFIDECRVLAYIGYKVDVISSVSLGISESSQRDSAGRKKYQKAVEDLNALYASVGGAYATGDVNGQYTRIALEGKSKVHEDLYLALSAEWLQLMEREVPLLLSPSVADELDSHARFRQEFEDWLKIRATQEIIAVGGDSAGMESIMYNHLHPNCPPSVLNGRRFASMKSQRIGVVPLQAHDGDIVVYLAGTQTSVVLRPEEFTKARDLGSNPLILSAFCENLHEVMDSESPYSESLTDLIQLGKGTVEDATIIGECYVEGIIGWSFKDRFEHHDFEIFALH